MASDYISIRKQPTNLSVVIHFFMNVFFGVSSVLVGLISGSWLIGCILVLVSKWRMFAVRPRYLFLNLKSNLVDLIVGFSFVLLAYYAGATPQPAHFIFAAAYTLWLTLIKPRSSENWNLFQALISIFVGTSAATILCAELNPVCLVALEFFIAYASARHVLVQRNDGLHDGFPAFIFAIFSSELALLAHSWLIVYSFPTLAIIIPQLTLILAVFAFLCAQLYFSVEAHDGRLKFSEAILPTLFSLAIIALIIFSYSQPKFNV